ncbi:hypothetical protein [Bradyrhizobium sp. WU425]|uniref:hypothetical protein n=1 Tax=Bradyrhizobium sp. WU425 TaxID=187029 RepID=UPI001E62851C|nr:hypothetical protein [Bradyrhizobium canariense]UFW75185.1 hypothetical protein BcanWU425_16020 [Bradyrhizobium canariense]
MRKAFAAIAVWARANIDARDVMLVSGLVLLAVGLWQVWPPAAFIVPGAIVSAVAIFAGRINGSAGEG